jgi:hypothetical protein
MYLIIVQTKILRKPSVYINTGQKVTFGHVPPSGERKNTLKITVPENQIKKKK